MKKYLYLVFICLLSSSLIMAQSSYSELDANTSPTSDESSPQFESIPAVGVDFYTDAVMQDDGCPISTALVVEDFASSLVGANSVCTGLTLPWSAAGGDGCFAAGDLEAGFTITTSGDDLALLTTGFVGAPTNLVGPNSFADVDLTINFTVPTNSFSFDLIDLSGTNDYDVSVFGASGGLGVISLTGVGSSLVYVGGIAAEDITSIVITDISPDGGGLIGNLSFDLCSDMDVPTVPTMGEWAIICLGMIMLIFGVVAVGQRQTMMA